MIDSTIGPYRIVRLLGEGGMGAVYEAVNDSIERRVAIKILRAEYAQHEDVVARFFNEARAVNRIAHPSLVQIHEQGSLPDGTAYIVMEYLDGHTLSDHLKESGGRLPARTAVQIAWQVAAALSAAHGKGIVHRDLNPSNLMLIPDPFGPGGQRVKVLDFGIATLFSWVKEGGPADQLIMGTPMYMSPEQCHGADAADEKTDVYSLGTVLFEMLAGRPPFVGEAAQDLIGMHLFRPPPSLCELAPEVPPELGAFTEQLLIKDKALRPSMGDAAQRLAQFAAADVSLSVSQMMPLVMGPPPIVAPPPPPQQPTLRIWRVLGAAIAGSIAAAGILVLVRLLPLVATRQQPVPPPPPVTTELPAEPVQTPPPVVQVPTKAPAPRRPPRPLSVKLPPLRTATAQPIHTPVAAPPVTPAQPVAQSSPAVDAAIADAQREYLMKNYAKAIELAKSVQLQSPLRAWRIIGSSACGQKDLALLKTSYGKLDEAGKQYLFFVCQRSGINTKTLFVGGKK